jgi:phage shock protein PspC (stress-responsive transcriptional regulator)
VSERDDLALLIQIMMAVFGGLARILNRKDERMRLAHVLSDLFVSAFTGIMLYWVSQAMQIEAPWMYAVSGIAGWAGPRALDAIMEAVRKKTGLPLDVKTDGQAGE